MKILLVSPAVPVTFWSYSHVLPLLGRRAAFPPLGLLTVAAMLPRDWELRLVDLNVRTLGDADINWADYVLLSAMIIHERSVRQVAARCQKLAKPVVAGGPLFTASHERFSEIPHFVLGEAEGVIAALIEDLRCGCVRPTYAADEKPALTCTPAPRWDLIRLRDYATMALQFSRGCPFDCEFCDIVAMYGRTPRNKSPEQFVRELDELWAAGWRETVFIVDDNFIGHRPRAKALLRAIAEWQARRRQPLPLLTEASLNLADDPELVELLVAAGFKKVFIGLETPDEASLVECGKAQNTRRDLVGSIQGLQRAGLEVMGGFIVGFDNDEHTIFERQQRFIQSAGVVTAMVGLLSALPRTRLFERLKSEGRLLGDSSGNNSDGQVNFIPRMEAARLTAGYRELVRRLYAPGDYYRRALTFLRRYTPRGPRPSFTLAEIRAFVQSLWILGVWTRGRRAYWRFLLEVLLRHRRAFGEAMNLAITGHHFRLVAAQL